MDFSTLLPYKDSEVPAVMQIVAHTDLFGVIVHQLNPSVDIEQVRHSFLQIRTIDEFQHYIMLPLILHIVKETTDGFTVSGLRQLSHDESYLFVANHRDIALDAALMSIQLMRHNYKLPAISFGDNLITNPLIQSLTRLNRMFPVVRGGTRREFYEASVLMSHYIQYMLQNEHRSVWIAQRNGRTKNGDDRTEPGLLKMLSLAGTGDFVSKMSRLKIVPLCISYEYEPCVDSKVREIDRRERGEKYVKRHNEDLLHVWEGISQQKGQVHLAFCPPITQEELRRCQDDTENMLPTEDTTIKYGTTRQGANVAKPVDSKDLNAPYHALAHLIDRRIWKAYRLSGMNHLAYDIVNGTASKDILLAAHSLFRTDTLLKVYAQPVFNHKVAEKEEGQQQ